MNDTETAEQILDKWLTNYPWQHWGKQNAIKAMHEFAALFQPPVIKSVCVHPYEKVYQSETECYCEICGHDFTEQTVL